MSKETKYNMMDTCGLLESVALSGSIVAFATSIITGDPYSAFVALGLGMEAQVANYILAVNKTLIVPDAKEGIESRLDGQ